MHDVDLLTDTLLLSIRTLCTSTATTPTIATFLHMMLIPLLQRFLQITDAELTLFDENLEASLPEITSALSQVQK